jgi:predicted nucleic acid-binding protein
MRPLSCLGDTPGLLIADTSVVINLNATGCAAELLHALPHKVAIVDVVQGELKLGRSRGRDSELTQALVERKHIEIVKLGNTGLDYFEQLVVGAASNTVDDGEAATLACALERGGVAVIDERKALRICGARFPKLPTASSLDLLSHSTVMIALGDHVLAEAVFSALRNARMRVFERHLGWVVELIGSSRLLECPSLPRHVRIAGV